VIKRRYSGRFCIIVDVCDYLICYPKFESSRRNNWGGCFNQQFEKRFVTQRIDYDSTIGIELFEIGH
jgi:hypothetical protein